MATIGPLIAISAGLNVASGLAQAAGDSRAAAHRSAEAQEAARKGRIAAAETDTTLREELSSVIGQIRSIRASSGISANSPTTAAIIDNETKVSDRERRIRVNNILSQADSDDRSAAYLRRSSRDAWLYGGLNAVGRGFSTLATAGR